VKQRKKAHSIPSLSPDATDEEIIRWTQTYNIGARLDAGISEIVTDHTDLDRLIEEAQHEGNTAWLNIRIPPSMKAALQKLARQRMTDATTLARVWLAERLQKELKT
jgi:hypothetical protein